MVLDIQTVHHILKNTAVQNASKQTVCLHYGLDFHFKFNDIQCSSRDRESTSEEDQAGLIKLKFDKTKV
jgi:hypothetical protein